MTLKRFTLSLFTPLVAISAPVLAEQAEVKQNPLRSCVMERFENARGDLTLKELRVLCNKDLQFKDELTKISVQQNKDIKLGVISRRILTEKETEFNPYVITPHKINYILPAYSTSAINIRAYDSIESYEDNLSDVEAHFQLSFKVPLNHRKLLIPGDGLYLGFTLKAWWQIYSRNISKPFRETNYKPELFYLAPLDWHPFGGNTGFTVGIEHESNGKSKEYSRSWNRIFGSFLFEKDQFALSFKPWIRLAEDKKRYPLDPSGDDNPDIEDYLGKFELGMVYKWDSIEFSVLGRQNFKTKYGAAELGITFPLWGKLRGYATAFTGYGDSLIDYNYRQTRFGLGVALTNVL
ncbi:phospholipase A [Thalassotalea piscium]|uniref:Phospholipase A1 n=1 Tax=Thalassotalea piscium TaxID=1230533 RepID=A0A7X0TSQ8_9GAMM|nr:phospholipase A [Thalassotalea piscium]MBB6542384.1 phospholipase A1 [Thalassotalea piscium]